MKKITTIILVAVTALAATSCLEHKVLGSFFGRYPQNVQLKYDFTELMKDWQQTPAIRSNDATKAPVTGTGEERDPAEEYVYSRDIQEWWVYAFPHDGNPDKKIYEFPISPNVPENATGAFLPIFSDVPGFDHFRGIYDFVVADDPLHEIPETLRFHATGNSLDELVTADPESLNNITFSNSNVTLPLAEGSPVQNGYPFSQDCIPAYLHYGIVRNELVPGSNEENTTHGPVKVPMDTLRSRSDFVYVPQLSITSQWSILSNPLFIVTGLAETWNIGKKKAGDKNFNVAGNCYSSNNGHYLFFEHYGKHPSAQKVELYILYLIQSPYVVNAATPIDGSLYLCYRKFDITDAIVNRKDIDLGEEKFWDVEFDGRTPYKYIAPTYDWIEIK